MSEVELQASRLRLEAAGIRLAIRLEGPSAKILQRGDAAPEGMVVWTPEEMFNYLLMSTRERAVFRGVKMKFDGRSRFVENA